MPAALASSTAYWISGLSTTVSISFGIALVAGRMRVPRPATGKTALRTGLCMALLELRHGPCGDGIAIGFPGRQCNAYPAPAANARRRNLFNRDAFFVND